MMRWSLALVGLMVLACGSFLAPATPETSVSAPVDAPPAPEPAATPTVWRGIPLPLDGGVVTADPFREGDEDHIAIAHQGADRRDLLDRYAAHAQQHGWAIDTAHDVGGARLVRDGAFVQLGAVSLVGGVGVLVTFSEEAAE